MFPDPDSLRYNSHHEPNGRHRHYHLLQPIKKKRPQLKAVRLTIGNLLIKLGMHLQNQTTNQNRPQQIAKSLGE